MSQEIQPGLIGEVTRTVTASDLASSVGSGRLDVFGTPAMLALVELAAVNAVDHLLPDGLTTVGTRLDVRHLSPSPLGIEVRARAEVTAVDGRKLSFLVEAYDAVEKIAEGAHERFIADSARLLARAQAKLPIP